MFSFMKKMVVTLALAALLLFGYQNQEALSQVIGFTFDLYVEGYSYSTPQFPVFFVLIACFLVGTFTAGFHGIYERVARKAEIRLRNRRIRALEKEVKELHEAVEVARREEPVAMVEGGDDIPKLAPPASGYAAAPKPLDEEPTL